MDIDKFMNDQYSKSTNYNVIPIDDNYLTLQNFIKKYSEGAKTSKVEFTGINHTIPKYISDKYSSKLYISKHGNKSINMKIREILSKLSESNFDILMADFSKYDLSYNIYDIINIIYENIIDLIYLADIYMKFIYHLKQKYYKSYEQLINKFINTATNPIIFNNDNAKTERWKNNNAIFLAKLYNNGDITQKHVENIISTWTSIYKDNKIIYIDTFIEFLKIFNPSDDLVDYYYNLICKILDNKELELPSRVHISLNMILDEKY